MDGMMCKAGETKVTVVPYGRRWFLTGVVILMFCLCLFCSDATAVYRITNIGDDEVSGLYSSGSGTWDGSNFGDTSYPGWVIGIANDDWGFGIWADGGDLTINGDLAAGSTIGGVAWTNNAYGLYSDSSAPSESIHTGALNGTIYAIAGTYGACGLFDANGDITTGDIGGTITATAGTDYAYGLYSSYGSINTGVISGSITTIAEGSSTAGLYSGIGDVNTGDITGTIDVTAGSYWAAGLASEANSVITGDIDGTIIVRAEDGYAYGLYSGSGLSIHTGDINGTISADVNNGSYAYALYSDSNITVGNIGSDAEITATANNGGGAGGLRSNGSIDVCDIDGTITITADRHAYGLRTDGGDITTGAINGDISATVEGVRAFGLYSNGGSININGDVNGTITATAGARAYGLRSDEGSITTGAINGDITATASTGSYAYGLYSDNNSITTGAIDGTITAAAEDGYAYGLYSGGGTSIHTGDINGTISADVNNGSYAYALYSDSNITVGNIGSDAEITATANNGGGAGGLRSNGSIDVCDIDGTITVTADRHAYGFRTDGGDITTGAINGDISATVEGVRAFGLYSNGGSININGDVNGTITATADRRAYGLRSDEGAITITGGINGQISAIASNGSDAYGLYSSSATSIHTGDINGEITAFAEIDNAYGLYSTGGYVCSINTGDIYGTISADANTGSNAYGMYTDSDINVGDISSSAMITATAEDSWAVALYSGGGVFSLHTGDINGTISADANSGSDAYGFYSNTDIVTGDIQKDAVITATAGGSRANGLYSYDDITTRDIAGTINATAGDYAYGLRSYSGDVNTGDVSGTITATSLGNDAGGLYTLFGRIITGDITGTITATADGSGNESAYGLCSETSDVTTGIINGTISAEMTNGSGAYALYSGYDMSIASIGSNANITATAGDTYAYGLYGDESVTIGDIDGVITASAWNGYAYGIYDNSGDSMNTGEINGTITAHADSGPYAYAIYSYGHIDIDDIGANAVIRATTGDSYAVGIYSEGSSSLSTGAISGTIDANAGGDFAYGILSYGPMDVLVDGGTIRAVALAGPNVAAIQSGRISGSSLLTTDANDTLEIVAGSVIVGDIDLAQNGSDDDLLTLSGNDGDSTTFDDDIRNIETIDITGGTWYVDGTISNSTNGITMYDGYLGGTGTLCSLHVIDGLFAPGSSIDTIIIDGNWIHDSDGIYEVDVNNTPDADLTIVTGWVDLDGTIRGNAPTVSGQRIDHSFSALVIDANTGLYNAFDTVTGTTLFPIYSVTYDAGNYDVYLDVEFDYAYYADTDNQHSVGDAFNYIVFNGLDTGDMNDVLWAIEHLPDGDAVNDAYNKMMPQDALGLPDVTRKIMNSHNDSVMDRMDNIRRSSQYAMLPSDRYLLASADNSVALPPQTNNWMPFVKGLGAWGDRGEESDVAGYNYSFYGIVAGMDKLVSENTLFGFGFGGSMANVDYSWSGTNADIDSFICSAHGSYFKDDWHLDWNVAYAHSWYDSQRRISFDAISREAKSEHQGDAYSVAVEFGKDLGDSSMILEPIAGVGYTVVQQRSYKEKGTDSLNLKVKADSSDGLYSKVGVRAAKEIHSEDDSDIVMVPKLTAFWIHDFAERVELSSSFIDGGSFKTEGLDAIRDTIDVGAGLNVYFGDNKQLFFDYSWQSANNFNAHILQTGVQWSF